MLNYAKIDLRVLKNNALAVKSKLKKGVKFCAVVKANAYGHGAPAVANCLYQMVDCFAVAILEEGVELRNSGIDKEILVLNPFEEQDIERAVAYSLTATVQSKRDIVRLQRECERQNKKISVHIKYNTGMNRLGVDSLQELREIIEFIAKNPRVKLAGMYSHLACPQNKKLLKCAVNKFLLANNLVKGYNNNAVCHVSASGGLLTGVQMDMVRVGILLYGYKPFPTDAIKVKPVMRVYAPIVKERALKVGERALYNGKPLKKDTDIKIIRFGYADGLERRKVEGQVNNRCMDLTAIECSKPLKLYPIMIDAEQLAKEYGTIPYEILVKISARTEKIYLT